MTPIIYAPETLDDIQEILSFLREQDPKLVAKFEADYRKALQKVRDFPQAWPKEGKERGHGELFLIRPVVAKKRRVGGEGVRSDETSPRPVRGNMVSVGPIPIGCHAFAAHPSQSQISQRCLARESMSAAAR